MMKFKKMHGLSNDFIIVDVRDGTPLPARDKIAAMTDRKLGIGCDQFIPMSPPRSEGADVYMQILNAPDASEVEACGNATRCVATLLMEEKSTDHVVVETMAGLLKCSREADGRITVDMGLPKLDWQDIPLAHEQDTLHIDMGEGDVRDPVGVNIGNPHIVFFVEDVENFPVQKLGPRFEHDPLLPARANIEFAKVLSPTEIRMRVWERDTGETQACGSAACGTMVAAVRRGYCERKARVILNGGPLDFHWREEDDHILMTGPVAHVFDGEVEL